MKISIIISIYNSHEAVRRQTEYFKKLNLGDDIEIIFLDDMSVPPLNVADYNLKNLSIYRTESTLAWTQGIARNLGASKARGVYLFFTDIDHIISKDAIDKVLDFDGPMMRFRRHFGILDETGELKTDRESLKEYGLSPRYLSKEVLDINTHLNTFAIKSTVFDTIGGYDEGWCNYGFHPLTRKGDDVYFNKAWKRYARKNNVELVTDSVVYVFPNGRFHKDGNLNPYGMFHDLSHKQEKFYKGEEL